MDSEAFPALSSRPTPPPPQQALPRVSTSTVSLVLPSSAIAVPRPFRTLTDVIAAVMRAHSSVRIDASTSNASTTFLFRSSSPAKAQRARDDLAQRLERRVVLEVPVPASTRPFIVGQGGKTLRSIQERTSVQIQVPKPTAAELQQQQLSSQENHTDVDNDYEISVSVTGPASAAQQARDLILEIVRQRTSKLTRRLTPEQVPLEYWPLLRVRVADILLAARQAEGALDISIPSGYKSFLLASSTPPFILITGDRDLVTTAEDVLKDQLDVLRRTTRTAQLNLPKRQHRFLVGAAAQDILERFACSVELPPIDDPSDQIVVRGDASQLGPALGEVMLKAQSAHVDILDLATVHNSTTATYSAADYSKDITRYLLRRQRLKTLSEQFSVEISAPRQPSTAVELVSKESAPVKEARAALCDLVKSIPPHSLSRLNIDPLLHRHLIGKNGQRVRAVEDKNKVAAIFPSEAEAASDDPQQSYILLVYLGSDEGTSSSTPPTPEQASATLTQVTTQLEKMANEAADLKVSSFEIPSNLHRYFLGPNGTTLNAIIGETKPVIVRLGSTNTNDQSLSAESVVIRGPSKEVIRVEAEIRRLAQEGTINEAVAEFTVDSRFIGHLVGKGGSGPAKLKEELDVRVEFGSPVESTTASSDTTKSSSYASRSKPKAAAVTASTSTVTIRGRKENVEEAKKRLLAQAERLADETTVFIPIPDGIDRGTLIGKQGAYVQRLETKYLVRINFPSNNNNNIGADGTSTPNPEEAAQIRIRGPKKGAEAAKREFIDLIAYEKENSNETILQVPEKSVSRLVGRNGNQLRDITSETGVSIDVVNNDDDEGSSDMRKVVIKGTSSGIVQAKKIIEEIVSLANDELTVELHIDPSLHVTLIGRGGQNISNLIQKCGGPSDTRSQSNLVRFPRRAPAANGTSTPTQSDAPADLVVVRGPSALATKIVKEIEEEVATLQSRIIWGVPVPRSSHSALIGRAGSGISDIQKEHNVKAIFPNWKEYHTVGEMANANDIQGADPSEVVKLVGSRDDCLKVSAVLQERAGAAPITSLNCTKTIMVPRIYHLRVIDSGKFLRALPSGVRLSHGDAVLPKKNSNNAGSASLASSVNSISNGAAAARPMGRIDQAAAPSEFLWNVVSLESEIAAQSGGNKAETDDIPWRFAASSQEGLDKAINLLEESLSKTRSKTHRATLQVPQPLMPRIVGRAGVGLDLLRTDYDCDVDVLGKRNSDTLSIVGAPDNLEKVRQYIVGLNRR